MAPDTAILDLLARQNGLITAAQAARHGMSERTLRRRVEADGWSRLAPRIFLAGGHPVTDRTRVRAAGLWVGDRGVVSGPAAAFWLGMLDTAPDPVEVTVPRKVGLRAVEGCAVRRRNLSPVDVSRIRGIRVTDRPLTALESAVALPEGSVFLDRSLQKHVEFDAAYRCYCRNMGARGFTQVGNLLVAAADRADSAAERLMITLLRGAGIAGWRHGLPFDRWVIDFAFPAAKVAVEVDGWAWHMDVERFRADRHKGNALVRAKWDLLRFTWHDLTTRPDYVLGEIRAALATSS